MTPSEKFPKSTYCICHKMATWNEIKHPTAAKGLILFYLSLESIEKKIAIFLKTFLSLNEIFSSLIHQYYIFHNIGITLDEMEKLSLRNWNNTSFCD